MADTEESEAEKNKEWSNVVCLVVYLLHVNI